MLNASVNVQLFPDPKSHMRHPIIPMNSTSTSLLLLLLVLAMTHSPVLAQEQPDKYALLVGVRNYEKPELNTGLKYPEKDAEALATILHAAGYEVDLLLGKQATARAIRAKLEGFSNHGGNKGVVFVALCGHGTEFADTKRSYFCPYDTSMKALRDKQGQALFDNKGNPMLGPTAESMVAIDDILLAFGESKAAHRILVADCCRDDANRARGRSFGTSLTTDRLPIQTLMLLGCSPQEQSLEHDAWKHGALTKCLLDQLEIVASTGKGTMGGVAEEVLPAVELLVSSQSNNTDKQTPRILSTGRVELLFQRSKANEKTTPPLFNFADDDKSSVQALASQQSWAEFQSLEVDRLNSVGMRLRLLPPGEFLMGSTETKADLESKGISTYEGFSNDDERPQHRVQISKSFYVGIHEVTLNQFLQYYNADKVNHKTDAEKDGKGGYGYDGTKFEQNAKFVAWNTGWNNPVDQFMDHPAVNVSWNDSVSFCEWLTQKERSSGLIRADQEYRLLDEAQWEYAARCGSRSEFGFGNNPNELTSFGNVKDSTFVAQLPNIASQFEQFGKSLVKSDGHAFTSPVGKYKPNSFGLYDMHGNVWEWCQDGYDENAYSARRSIVKDPFVKEGSLRVHRGGSWERAAVNCRSADRIWNSPGYRVVNLGFRVSLQSVR